MPETPQQTTAAPVTVDMSTFKPLPQTADMSTFKPLTGQQPNAVEPKDVWANKLQELSPSSMADPRVPSLIGAAKGVAETGHTLGRIVNAVTGDHVPWLPTSLEQPKELESANAAESAGKIGETIAEFVLGDEALKGMSILEKLGVAQKITELAKTSPTLAKLVNLGLNAGRGATTGAVVGGAHEGVQGAEVGAASGAAAELAAPAISKGVKAVKSLIFPSEGIQNQVVKDAIHKSLGSKVDADVAEEISSRMDKPKVLSSYDNEIKLAKGKIDAELPEMNKALDETLAKSTAKSGNAARLVNEVFNDQVEGVASGVGTGKQNQIDAINEVRKEVMEKLSNEPMTAQELNDVKRLVGDQIKKFAPPENLTTVDAQKKEAYRQVYFKLRDMVSELSPESKELNGRISRAISAQDVLEKKFPHLKTPEQIQESYSGERQQAAKQIGKHVGKAVTRGVAIGAGAKLGYDILRGAGE